MPANAARKLDQAAPATSPHRQPRAMVITGRVPLSVFERLSIALAGLLAVGLMLTLVAAKQTVNGQQRVLQTVQKQITAQTSQNTSQRQEIGELTSQTSLKQVAGKYGLKDANASVRNVNK